MIGKKSGNGTLFIIDRQSFHGLPEHGASFAIFTVQRELHKCGENPVNLHGVLTTRDFLVNNFHPPGEGLVGPPPDVDDLYVWPKWVKMSE